MRPARHLFALAATALAAACGSAEAGTGATTLHLGYQSNLTHASAVYGVATGTYARELGPVRLRTQTFNAGPAEVEALFAGAIDAAYLGPGPAVNAFLKSRGDVVIVAGATSAGAALVVRPGVTALHRGMTIADPQTGGTQDIALRTYLHEHGWRVDRQGRGAVRVQAEDNAQTLALFRSGDIDGAWVPEPWASRLVVEGGGTVLVDESSLWPGGQFSTTNLLVRKDFLRHHPDAVRSLIRAQATADAQIARDPAAAKVVLNAALKRLTGKGLRPVVIDRAMGRLTLTMDPLAASLRTIADHAFATGLLSRGPLTGIYDLTLLREVTHTQYDDAGLGD